MDDKTQIAILTGVIFGSILGVTTGYFSIGIQSGVFMAIAGAIGFRILNIRKIKHFKIDQFINPRIIS